MHAFNGFSEDGSEYIFFSSFWEKERAQQRVTNGNLTGFSLELLRVSYATLNYSRSKLSGRNFLSLTAAKCYVVCSIARSLRRRTITMCGRVNAQVSLEDVQKLFSVKEDKDEDKEEKCNNDVKFIKWINEGVHSQLQNCAPSETVATLVAEDEVWTTRFGLIPSYKKSPYDRKRDHYVAFNCRSETVLERQMFNRCVEANAKDKGRGRAVVLIRGFYEWKKDKMGKQPYYVSRKDGELLCVCAVMDTYKGDDYCNDGEILRTTSLLTRDSKGTRLSWLHDRMPVMLKKEAVKTWLTDNTKRISAFLVDDETTTHQGGGGVIEKGEDLQWYPVTPEMGKIEFQGDACVKEVVAVAKMNTQDIKSMFAKVVAKQSAEKLSQVKIDNAFAETANCDKEDEPPAKKKLKL